MIIVSNDLLNCLLRFTVYHVMSTLSRRNIREMQGQGQQLSCTLLILYTLIGVAFDLHSVPVFEVTMNDLQYVLYKCRKHGYNEDRR